jgi:hypothetical protein
MDRKGLFNEEQEAFLIGMVFYFANFNSKIWQFVSKPVIAMLIKGVDNFVLDKLSPELKSRVIPIINAAMERRVNHVQQLLVDWAATDVKIQYTSRDRRMEFADSVARAGVTGIALYAEYREGKKLAA